MLAKASGSTIESAESASRLYLVGDGQLFHKMDKISLEIRGGQNLD